MTRHRGIEFIFLAIYALELNSSEENGIDIVLFQSDEIRILNLNTNITSLIANTPSDWIHIDYDKRHEYIYWTDLREGTLFRTKYSYDHATDVQALNEKGRDIRPYDIAVDSVNDLLYWTDTYSWNLMRSELDGSNKTIILNNVCSKQLAVDPINRWLYFADCSNSMIVRCKIDGTGKQKIINVAGEIMAISTDPNENRLYWTTYNEIKSATIDGNDEKIIYNSSGGLYAMDVSDNYLYFSMPGYICKIDKSGSNLKYLYYVESLQRSAWWSIDFRIYRTQIDQCIQYTEIRSEEKRSTGYIISKNDVSINDDNLEENWYRVFSPNGNEMSFFPPGVMHCGTVNPIWLNGTLPKTEDFNVTRTACVQTDTGICEDTIEIKIRNCNGYYVYYLKNTTAMSAYCFGSGPVVCPAGQSSESGNYPGCTTSFPKEEIPVSVEAVLIEGTAYQLQGLDIMPSMVPVFKCTFNDVSNGSYLYDIYWYINGNHVMNKTNIQHNNINSTVLRGTDWINKTTMNMEVQCGIRMRYATDLTPSPLIYSLKFKAGLYPDRTEYTVIEGDSINIGFTSTVPVGCISSQNDFRKKQCYQNFYIFQPEHTKVDCSNNIMKRDIIFKAHFCGIQIGSFNWKEKQTLQVFGFSDGLYNSHERSTYIRISTPITSMLNEIWKNVNISDIKITVIDKDYVVTNRICQSYNDPHITTFDGRIYHYMQIGEFVIYRNPKGPYWVRTWLI